MIWRIKSNYALLRMCIVGDRVADMCSIKPKHMILTCGMHNNWITVLHAKHRKSVTVEQPKEYLSIRQLYSVQGGLSVIAFSWTEVSIISVENPFYL